MKASDETKKLFTYMLPYIQRVARAAGTAAAVGIGGAPTPHALQSVHHTGTISNAQAPQFLLTDGTRPLMGSLAVTPSATLDGVDLSAHAADPNAHHAVATAGNTAISVAGQAVSFVPAATSAIEIVSGARLKSSLAGAGLLLTSQILDVTPGDGIRIVSDAVQFYAPDVVGTAAGIDHDGSNNIIVKRSSPDSGLAFALDGGLTLGTPTTISATTVNGVSGVSHVHTVTSSSDVGTTPPGVNRLLHATSTGGLILGTLTVKGSVDIINGGDFTVGANVLFVDVSQESVGILRAPDAQFALDVNGPIRGTEIVGKHAIQLADLGILLHFDGGEPYESNYTGELNAIPMGRPPATVDNLHFRPGKFYKSLVFGNARTNLSTNPSFETNTSNWSIFNGAGGNLAAARDTVKYYFGIASAKLTWTTIDNSQFYHQPVASAAGANYSFGCWMRAEIPTTVNMLISRGDSPFTIYRNVAKSVTEDWQYFTITTTTTPTAGTPLRVTLMPSGAANAVYVDGVQLEQGNISTWYFDGSLGSAALGEGFAWTGTEHLSTSTRSLSVLSYALQDFVPHRWTVMGWFCFPYSTPPDNQGLLRMNFTAGSGQYYEFFAHSNGLHQRYVPAGGSATTALIWNGTFTPGQWVHVALVYNAGTIYYYVDGEAVGSRSISYDAAPSSMHVGFSLGGAGDFMLDDLVLSRQALSAERVRAIYESDAPVFAESSVFHFRSTPKGLVWADEEGLWMRDINGDTVLGAYGGEAATKSWGGFTLAAGDIAFGRYGASDGGWFWFDRDGVSSKPYLRLGYSDKTVMAFDTAGASLTGVLDIDTSGGIYQGTGTFASPTTGLKLWNDSGVGRIGGYNASVVQWYANTDGKLYAGGGNVVIDAGGIGVNAPQKSSVVDGFTSARSIFWRNGIAGTAFAAVSGENDIGFLLGRLVLSALSGVVGGSEVYLQAINAGNAAFNATLSLRNTGTITANIHPTGGFFVVGGPSFFNQDSTTGAIPTLMLYQADLSEEFIQFNGTVAAGNPIDTAALGTYYGKVRVSVNGTFKMIGLYNS